MGKVYHRIAKDCICRKRFVETVRAWWWDNFNTSPPKRQYLYKWYDQHGY